MLLIIIGALLLLASKSIDNPNLIFSKFASPIRKVAIVLIVLGISSSTIKQIDAGEVGV
jgi:uncharacterized membrane protein